ncbi:MAG: UPF0104 family protein [Planctomycetales bacterium]|nr:UPF0104 family protein [Planctomycetales bacterium]
MLIRVVVLVAVIYFIIQAVLRGRKDLAEQEFSLREVNFRWLGISALLYAAAMIPMGIYWFRMLHALQQSPRFLGTFRAYCVGHLGKYVPGKAMVVVLRTGLLAGPQVNKTIVGASVFAETLTMMAVGAFIAAAMIAWKFSDQTWLLLMSIGLMLAAGFPTIPPVFTAVVKRLRLKSDAVDVESCLDGFTWRLMLFGWLANGIAWCFIAMSLWAVIQAMPERVFELSDGPDVRHLWTSFPSMLASTSLAMVAGFLSGLPGGVGVREVVFTQLLQNPYGEITALIAPVLLRLVWLAVEFALAAVLMIGWRSKRQTNCAKSQEIS